MSRAPEAPAKLPKVLALPEGTHPPEGYVIALIDHPSALGIHAVKPDQHCQECWGRGMSKVNGTMQTCSCVLRRIDRFVRAGGA